MEERSARLAVLAGAAIVLCGCSGESTPAAGAETGDSAASQGSQGAGGSDDGDDATTTGSSTTAGPDGDGSTGGSDTSEPDDGSSGGSTGQGGGASGDTPQDLPAVNGPCPEFSTGAVTFNPADADSNDALLWVGDAPGDGPMVFYFHGTGMSADDATWSLGQQNIDAILAEGGVVISPEGHGPYAWWIGEGDTREDDLRLIDEMVACAIQEVNIDVRRIHATGLSSGATLTSDMIHRRSNYLASGSPKSGGFDPYNPIPPNVEPNNKMSALIFHGGSTDTWGDPPYEFYEPQSEQLATIITDEGGFAAVCNHGQGHAEPTWDQDAVWQFFRDHPYNTSPSPYQDGLPGAFPDYCTIW